MSNKLEVLGRYFGYSSFREGQEELVDALVSRRDVLGIMPTGAGKSLCYQVPALMFSGITLVVSPLISLMKDQVSALVQQGIHAAFINSSLNLRQYSLVLRNLSEGQYKIVYVAPERLLTDSFLNLCKKLDISFVAVDEAHCVSQWGQDFRPSYMDINTFIAALPKRPVLGAFTATATKVVRDDIVSILKLNDPLVTVTGFDRPNLFFSVMQPKDKRKTLVALVKERSGKSGIVYCSTRKKVEEVCDLLNEKEILATRYHAGLMDEERRKNQEDFVHDRKPVIVATNAFGMGIDKSNVAFVIHFNMPKNIESYYQEAGRAGRDGSPADCILLYGKGDVQTAKFFIENSESNPALTERENTLFKEREEERLKYMTFYSTTTECLRKFMLRYFGDKYAQTCENCSNCMTDFETIDITVDAQKILSCIIRMKQNYGKKTVTDVLRGSDDERIKNLGFDSLSTYGIMKDLSSSAIRFLIDKLEGLGYIEQSGEYPVLKITEKCKPLLYGQETLTVKKPKKVTLKQSAKLSTEENDLLKQLKILRLEKAKEKGVPAYIIFTDKSLVEMSERKPVTPSEFLEINGVGENKLNAYGDDFIKIIKKSQSRL